MKLFTSTALALFLSAAPVVAQVRDFGEIAAETIESRVAGIGGFRMQREGPEENTEEWVVTAETFGLAGELLGAFEIRYPTKGTVELSYVRADSGAFYRIRADETARSYEFEHVGVEAFTITANCDPSELMVPGQEYTPEELEALQLELRECGNDITITGTTKSLQEAVADNREITDFLAAANVEVKNFLGVTSKSRSDAVETLKKLERERPEREPVRLKTVDPQSMSHKSKGRETKGHGSPRRETLASAGVLKIGGSICPPGQEQYCPFGNNNFAVLGEDSVFLSTKSACCTGASADADISCTVSTLLPCCANSFCTVTSPLPCSIWCNCQVIGYAFGCQDPCV